MKKRITTVVLALLAISLAISLLACSAKALDAPTNLRINGDTLSWDKVDDADSYEISIYGNTYESEGTYFYFTQAENLVSGQSYTVKVKAISDDPDVADSDYSSAVTYKYVNDDADQPSTKQLSAPIIIEVSNDRIYWNDVNNATSYLVKINSYQQNVGSNLFCDIATVMDEHLEAGVPTLLYISVRAKGNSAYYSDSVWSNKTLYTYTKPIDSPEPDPEEPDPTPTPDPGDGTYLNSGIGRGVNVVAATNYNDYIKGASIIDKTYLENDDLFVMSANAKGTKISTSSNQQISDFVSNNSITFDIKTQNKSKIKTMYSNIDVGLSSGVSINYSSYTDQNYYSLDSYTERYSLYLDEYADKDKYANMFSSGYVTALKNLYNNQNTDNFINFFNTYGTHLIVSGTFGGRLNAYYSVVTNKATIDSTVSTKLKAAIESGISAVNNSTLNTNVTTEIQNVLKTSEFSTSFYVSACGGNAFTATTIESLNTSYGNWASSFNDNSDAVLINYTSDGLIGLWDILPSQYSSMASNMKTAFEKYYNTSYSSFITSFDFVNPHYDGGKGTSSDPYLVATATQFTYMVNNCSQSEYYKLKKDIDLGDWNDYGIQNWNDYGIQNWAANSRNANHYFTGNINGNNYTVTYKVRIGKTSLITWAFGLFPAINNCTLQNIKVNCDLQTYDPQGRNQKWDIPNDDRAEDALVGGLVGYSLNSKIYNCSTSGTVRYNSDGGSGDTCVAGVVGYALNSNIDKCSSSATVYARGCWVNIAGVIACYHNTSYSSLDFTGSRSYDKDWSFTGSVSQGDLIAGNKEILTKD